MFSSGHPNSVTTVPLKESRESTVKTVDVLFEESGLWIEDIAERSNLSEERVEAIALGRWTPSPKERAKIAAVLNASVEDISWGHTTPIQHIYGHGPG